MLEHGQGSYIIQFPHKHITAQMRHEISSKEMIYETWCIFGFGTVSFFPK